MLQQFSQLEKKYGLPSGLLDAVAATESSYNPKAIGPVTKSGERAQGMFQFMPKTAQAYGIDPFNVEQAAEGAARMYSDLLNQYNGNVVKALAAYNWGSGNIATKGIENMPKETRDYISKIVPKLTNQNIKQESGTQYADSGNIMTDATFEPVSDTIEIELPDGRILDVPNNPDSIALAKQKLKEKYANKSIKNESLFGRISSDIQKRGEQLSEVSMRQQLGQQTTPESLLQYTGTLMGGASDVIGETAISALSAITPDLVKEAAGAVGNKILQTDIGKAGLQAAASGIDSYNEWASQNPRAAKNLESVINIGMFAAPTGKAAKSVEARSLGAISGKFDDAADFLVTKGKHGVAQKKTSFVRELVSPEQTKAVKTEQVYRTSERGMLRKQEVEPNKFLKDIEKTVSKVKGLDQSRSLQFNFNVMQKEVAKEVDSLERKLSKIKVTFPKKEYKAALERAVVKVFDSPVIVGDAEKTAQKLVGEFYKIVDEVPATPSGLLEARKKFDKIVTSYKPTAFDPKSENAFTEVVRQIRGATNDFIASKTPNVDVKKSLRKSHHILTAMENLAPKASVQGKNAITRTLNRLSGIVPLKAEIASIAALGGMSAFGYLNPVTAGLSGAGYVGYKTATNPQTKIVLGQILNKTNDAIKLAKDKKIITELKAHRAVLSEAISNLSEEEQQSPRRNALKVNIRPSDNPEYRLPSVNLPTTNQ